jgi:hypothetical protein
MPRFPATPLDTDPEIERRRIELYRSMSPQRKVELVEDANRTARELAMAGIALRHPEATEAERVRILFGLILGEELATQVYGPHPLTER